MGKGPGLQSNCLRKSGPEAQAEAINRAPAHTACSGQGGVRMSQQTQATANPSSGRGSGGCDGALLKTLPYVFISLKGQSKLPSAGSLPPMPAMAQGQSSSHVSHNGGSNLVSWAITPKVHMSRCQNQTQALRFQMQATVRPNMGPDTALLAAPVWVSHCLPSRIWSAQLGHLTQGASSNCERGI